MKRHGDLWPRVIAFDNLLLAYRKARRGKRGRADVARFGLALEKELLQLQRELREDRYAPGGYRHFEIYERKPRIISAAPFRDRVIHHALMNVVEPLLDARLSADCYACRRGKGVHAAVARYQRYARRYPYALKLDISGYFASVDHALLNTTLARHLKDARVLALFSRIIASGESPAEPVAFPGDDLVDLMSRKRGLPVGNLTSQVLANLYLSDLDHRIRQVFGVRAYLRYVDDLILLGDDKSWLWERLALIREALTALRLRVHPRKAHVMPVAAGVEVLGYRVYPTRIRLRRDNGYRYRRRLRAMAKQYARGERDLDSIKASVASWAGHTRHAEASALVNAVLASVVFTKGGSCAAALPARDGAALG
jgi:RNA-directed DNA polymerase